MPSYADGRDTSDNQVIALNKIFKKLQAKTEFLIGYGMSEVGATACSQMNGCTKLGSVGIPLIKNCVSAFDPDTLEEKKYNQSGELCISSPSLMLGYLGNKSETEEAIKIHSDGKRWMHTGDLGYVDEDGFVFVQGRLKRIYLTEYQGSLSKIFPDRIEKTVIKHPQISECCAVCYSIIGNQYRHVVFATLHNREDYSNDAIDHIKQELITLCKKELPEYDQPAEWFFVQTLPLTPIGKIDYRALEDQVNKGK